MKTALSPKLRRFRKDDRGTVAIMFGLLAIPMVMFVGFAVDYSRVVAADRDLQEAVDAAALAAALYKLEKNSSSSRVTSDGEITQGEGSTHTDGILNVTIFRDLDPHMTCGLETNFTFGERDRTKFLLIPQLDFEITDHVQVQFGAGPGFSVDETEWLVALRVIYSR